MSEKHTGVNQEINDIIGDIYTDCHNNAFLYDNGSNYIEIDIGSKESNSVKWQITYLPGEDPSSHFISVWRDRGVRNPAAFFSIDLDKVIFQDVDERENLGDKYTVHDAYTVLNLRCIIEAAHQIHSAGH